MITPGWVQKMSTYNGWMNRGIYKAAATLTDARRKKNVGAFFGSIHATLNHLLWGDQIWMHRLAGFDLPPAAGIPQSVSQFDDFEILTRERESLDQAIGTWANSIDDDWLTQDHHWYSGSMERDMITPNWILVTHLFNHQTHHRGQVHCLLTQAGAPTPTTDLPFAP